MGDIRTGRSVCVLIPSFGVFVAIQSCKHRGAMELPGGKVEPGEALYDAARREVIEEVGLAPVGVLWPLGDFVHEFGGVRWTATAFVGDLGGAHPRGGDDGPATWATRAELLAGTYGEVLVEVFAAYDEWEVARG